MTDVKKDAETKKADEAWAAKVVEDKKENEKWKSEKAANEKKAADDSKKAGVAEEAAGKKKVDDFKKAEASNTEASKKQVKDDLAVVHKIRIKADERAIIEAHFVDDFGNVAPLKENPVWTSSNESIVRCVPCTDLCMCDIRPTGNLGTAIVTVSALGDKAASNTVEVTVLLGALATQVGMRVVTIEKWQH